MTIKETGHNEDTLGEKSIGFDIQDKSPVSKEKLLKNSNEVKNNYLIEEGCHRAHRL